jgi:hypothetical protein
MDLPTHFAFALAVGLVFTNNPEVALLISLGALLPDLDREYWFIPRKIYADEQIHRAGLHNIFMMALTYLISPYLSLGIFLHVLQDSFTTVKDRGVEWFYPFTRLVRRGRFNCEGIEQPLDPKEKVYFYQEDPPGLAKKADPDLQGHYDECRPVPWRRVYGFAQNSQILDRSFLVGSIVVILVWLFVPTNSTPHLEKWSNSLSGQYFVVGVGFLAIVILFLAGELDRRGHIPRLGRFNVIKYPIFAFGVVLLGAWGMLMAGDIENNVRSIILSSSVSLVMVVIIVPLAILGVIKWKTRRGKIGIV